MQIPPGRLKVLSIHLKQHIELLHTVPLDISIPTKFLIATHGPLAVRILLLG